MKPETFRSIRVNAGLSQSQAASLLGISVRTLQQWEQSRADLEPSVTCHLAARLLNELTHRSMPPIK